MFKVPKSLKEIDILGKQIQIVLDQKHCELQGAMGMYDGTIIIREKYDSHVEFMQTLIHEAFHATCHTVGLQLDIQIEEVLAVSSERLHISLTQCFAEIFSDMTQESPDVEPKRKRGRPRKS